MEKQKTPICGRRAFLRMGIGLAAGARLALTTGCGGSTQVESYPPEELLPPYRADAKVVIVRCSSYEDAEVREALAQAFALLGGIGALVARKTVTVKVNLTCDGTFRGLGARPAGETYITHGATVIAVAELLLQQQAKQIRIVESAPFREPMAEFLTLAGWDVPTLLGLGSVELENTRNQGQGQSYVRLSVPSGGYLFSYFDVNHSYQDTDVVVSMAKLKQHLTAGVTLSAKNLFGITPNSLYSNQAGSEDALGWRSPLHGEEAGGWGPIPLPGARTDRNPDGPGFRVPRIIADLCAARPVHLAIIDGIMAISGGEGPWAPNTKPTSPGILIAGLNPISADAVATAVMGFPDPRARRGTPPFTNCDNHLLLAEQAKLGLAYLPRIEVRGLSISQARYPYTG